MDLNTYLAKESGKLKEDPGKDDIVAGLAAIPLPASRQATMSMRYRSACFDYLSVKNKIAAASPLPSNTHEKMSLVAHLS